MIDEQNMRIANGQKELFDSSSRHLDLIWESTYFDSIGDVFEEWFTDLFDSFIVECRQKAIRGESYDLEKTVKVSDIAKNLSLDKIKNYKNLHDFIRNLEKSNGVLTISLTDGFNCYEPPIEWIGEKLQIQDRRHDVFNEPIDKAGELYKDYMLKLSEKCRSLSEKYLKIKNAILNQLDFGHIKINFSYFRDNEKLEFKRSVLMHEFGHFLDFIIKINAENWNIGRQYRSHIVHSDFNALNASDNGERMNYMLDEDEFKRLSSTYVEHLRILFNRFEDRSLKSLELFLEAVMTLFGIDVHYYENATVNDLKDYIACISSHFYFNDMKDFFVFVYKDSKAAAENEGVRNRWTILKKWLWRELKTKCIDEVSK
jgi:hypothetical protein